MCNYGCENCLHLDMVGTSRYGEKFCRPVCRKRKDADYQAKYKGIDCEAYKPGGIMIPEGCKLLSGGKPICEDCPY